MALDPCVHFCKINLKKEEFCKNVHRHLKFCDCLLKQFEADTVCDRCQLCYISIVLTLCVGNYNAPL